jgi:bifunctional non-homologous end joining protein LigD
VPKEVELIEEQVHEKEKPAIRSTSASSNWKLLEAIKPISETHVDIGNCSIRLTDIDKEIWKGVTKARLIQYYHGVSKYILPHLKDRPLSLYIKHKGPFGKGLYIKDMEGRQPDCANIFSDTRRHKKTGKRDQIDYLVCNNEPTLLYTINLGCIDVNPWMSRTSNIEEPDFINIDLDPSDNKFEKAIEVAQVAKEVLSKHKLKAFPKTSGKTGIHIYIPVVGMNFAEARSCSELLGQKIYEMVPKISTLNVNINSRGNKLFIDYSQNDYADTLACVYSVRPSKIPTVSTPLDWKEIRTGLTPEAFTIDTILERIKRKGELFRDVLNKTPAKKNATILKKLL